MTFTMTFNDGDFLEQIERKGNTEITIVQVDEPTDMKSVTAVCSTATRITIYSTILDVKEILSKEDSE